MPELNWEIFAGLPGDKAHNFEQLCRSIIRLHYGRYGDFRALANQPGVEFHLRLHTSCSLGEPGRWYGWQCKWYDLQSGRAIGTTRRRQIEEAIRKTEEILPELTDWVLWTRHLLTAGDQEWFYSLQTHMRLNLWTAAEVETLLSGPAEILCSTYFGELVLTPDLLSEKHNESVARIAGRWLPDVHQTVDAERSLRRTLGEEDAWSDLTEVAKRLRDGAAAVSADLASLPENIPEEVNRLVKTANLVADALCEMYTALASGDYEIVQQELSTQKVLDTGWNVLLRQLRKRRLPVVLRAINVVADISAANQLLDDLRKTLEDRLIAVVADAGCGKTHLAAQLTAPGENRPAGVLIHGRDLPARETLDALARKFVINGRPVESFEALVAAVEAAGCRAGRRLPIFIDGLNEAEDPRDWKQELASLKKMLAKYPYVVVVCTLRSDFVGEALPDEVRQLEVPDFGHDTYDAVRRYFQYYRIDPSDAVLPWRLLQHPLTLRMFCEVTNPKRERVVGAEAMPGSLTALFERYLEQVAERIAQLSPRSWRYFESDVRTALNKIGLSLWEAKVRSLNLDELRRSLGDDARPWDQSIVRALEQEGVLIRVSRPHLGSNQIAVVHDALTGHLVADALLEEYAGPRFAEWLHEEATAMLGGDVGERHPLATDIFIALVGLTPRRRYREQLWTLLDEPLRTKALYESAWLDKEYLDSDTVSQLAALSVQPPQGRRDLFDRLWTIRAAQTHPLNVEFLDDVLRSMSMPDRDLRWSEWIRSRQEEVLDDIKWLEQRWRSAEGLHSRDKLRARWVMWTLTSTVRLLRDHATRALYWFGCRDPKALFELTLDSLSLNDPYVPERMLAACYGVAMSLWADPRGDAIRMELPEFANKLVDKMFIPGAPHGTRHVLMREYALGTIDLAKRIASECIPAEKQPYLNPPFNQILSPFPRADEIEDDEVAEAKDAIHMDFGNYTIGTLIPDRGNYDFNYPTYREVRRQIEYRIVQLGYSSDRFGEIDRAIGELSWRGGIRRAPKVDRYGKKYSWIAFFEMYGLRLDEGSLPEWEPGERPSDADIDPSFPEPARVWQPSLPDLFAGTPTEPRAWITNGPSPDYEHLLNIEEIDGRRGPWVLLNGFIEQSSRDDERRVFTFLRGLLVEDDQVERFLATFRSIEYPGNIDIPAPREDYYTYAGEIPWSPRFGKSLREPDGRAKRDVREAFALHGDGGIPVEVPVYRFTWERYHSPLNQVSGITVPAPALCEQLSLSNRQGEWDLYDPDGYVATIYREFKTSEDTFHSYFLYLRSDLLKEYLDYTRQTLVLLLWGERNFKPQKALELRKNLQDLWANHTHIHYYDWYWKS